MKIEISLKDMIIFTLIITLAVFCLVQFAAIKAQLQTTALVKAVNDQGAAIQQIVTFLNSKTAGTVTPAKGIDLVNTPNTK